MEDSVHDIKVKIRIGDGDEDDDRDEELTTPEAVAVKGKLETHHIKRMSTLLKVSSLASVDGMLKRLLKSQLFLLQDGSFKVDVAPLVLHGGMVPFPFLFVWTTN
jgi:hypothetical protein